MSAGHDPLHYRGKRFLRGLGAILITACCVMLILGQTMWRDTLTGPSYVSYWSWCFLLLIVTILLTFVDMLLIRRASRQARRQLLREQFPGR